LDEEGIVAEGYAEVLSHSADKNMVVIQKLVMVFSFVESHYIST
jgi:hypothetical protein